MELLKTEVPTAHVRHQRRNVNNFAHQHRIFTGTLSGTLKFTGELKSTL